MQLKCGILAGSVDHDFFLVSLFLIYNLFIILLLLFFCYLIIFRRVVCLSTSFLWSENVYEFLSRLCCFIQCFCIDEFLFLNCMMLIPVWWHTRNPFSRGELKICLCTLSLPIVVLVVSFDICINHVEIYLI